MMYYWKLKPLCTNTGVWNYTARWIDLFRFIYEINMYQYKLKLIENQKPKVLLHNMRKDEEWCMLKYKNKISCFFLWILHQQRSVVYYKILSTFVESLQKRNEEVHVEKLLNQLQWRWFDICQQLTPWYTVLLPFYHWLC